MKTEISDRNKTVLKVNPEILQVSSITKLLTFPLMIVDSHYKYESIDGGLAPSIWAVFLIKIKESFEQKVLFACQQRIRWLNRTDEASNSIHLVEDKNRIVIILLSPLSKFFALSELRGRYEQSKLCARAAIISATNHDVLCVSETYTNVQRLCQCIQGLNLNLSDSFWLSPVSVIKNLRTKGSAPMGSKRTIAADSIHFMFVVLGWSGDNPTESIEVFDSNTQKWYFFQRETPYIRAYHGVALVDNSLYVVGGFNGHICLATMLCLNLKTRRWRRKRYMSISRCYVLAIALGGLIYAIGGHSGMNRLKTCERFDPNRNMWTRISDMMYRRSDAAGVEINGKIIVSGGFDGFQFHSTVEIYSPVADQWTLIGNLTHPRSGHSMISMDGHVYVLGGFNGFRRMQEVEEFKEDTNNWESCVPMLTGRSNFCTAIFQQEIYAIGGFDGSSTISSVEKFDKLKMEWQTAPGLNIHRSASGVCVMKNSDHDSSCAINELIPVVSANIEEPSP